ncbi:hypothetical protein M0R45_001967 [Rubus argutus]|uniref:DNA topoisomerase (ATP-hydrolyzing) n=1 Tax=Rubus argutus TaxID=59490 RepID=A0AAW1VEU0_RUBAR
MRLKPMIPCYRGFKGTIINDPASNYKYIARGLIEQVDATTLKIKELPIGKWLVDYEAFLESISQPNYKGKGPIIEAYTNLGNDIDIEIQVELSEENLKVVRQKDLVEEFRLTRRISIKNMHLHDRDGIIKKYDTPEQIIKEFYGLRLPYYDRRLNEKKRKLELENEILDNKIRFITLVGEKEIDLSVKRPEILDKLTQKNFRRIPGNNSEAVISDFHYLLSMSLESLCFETVDELIAEKMMVQEKLEGLRKLDSKSLWLDDLNALERQFQVMEKEKGEKVVPLRWVHLPDVVPLFLLFLFPSPDIIIVYKSQRSSNHNDFESNFLKPSNFSWTIIFSAINSSTVSKHKLSSDIDNENH